jgi:V-type H+-transporting ATPase subunit D
VLVQLATLQTSFVILDEAIKVTSRRVNALDTVVIPKIVNTVEYIKSELDELEREEFFRLKRSQDKKKADLKIREAEKNEKMAAEAKAAAAQVSKDAGDSDVVF